MAGTTRKRSNDFTGRQAEELAAAAAEEKAQAAEKMAMMTAEKKKEFDESVYDMRGDSPVIVDEVISLQPQMEDGSVKVRVAETIENMTYGHGRTYSFKAGGQYIVPRGVADRMQALGLLYDRI